MIYPQESARVYVLLHHWREYFRSLLVTFGSIFLPIEAFEVISNGEIEVSILSFAVIALLPGTMFFLVDGFLISGYLKRQINVSNPYNSMIVKVGFGDIFLESGWKAIGVNDFFDTLVDDDLVSSNSLHGMVIKRYWDQNRGDLTKQVKSSLKAIIGHSEQRSKGNRTRYPIGTTARAIAGEHKFLMVALGQTDLLSNQTSANTDMLIRATRGMLSEARSACSRETLVIPLLGSGLARVNMDNSVILDLILTAIFEESGNGLITDEIKIILPEASIGEFNLKNHSRKWR